MYTRDVCSVLHTCVEFGFLTMLGVLSSTWRMGLYVPFWAKQHGGLAAVDYMDIPHHEGG